MIFGWILFSSNNLELKIESDVFRSLTVGHNMQFRVKMQINNKTKNENQKDDNNNKTLKSDAFVAGNVSARKQMDQSAASYLNKT